MTYPFALIPHLFGNGTQRILHTRSRLLKRPPLPHRLVRCRRMALQPGLQMALLTGFVCRAHAGVLDIKTKQVSNAEGQKKKKKKKKKKKTAALQEKPNLLLPQ